MTAVDANPVHVATDGDSGGWTAIAPFERLTPDRGVAALVDGVQVAVVRLSTGALHAVDNVDPCYPRAIKEANLAAALCNPRCRLAELDIRDAPGAEALVSRTRPDVIVHLAARAGVRPSIEAPALYAEVNVTQAVATSIAQSTQTIENLQPQRQAQQDVAQQSQERQQQPSCCSIYGCRETRSDSNMSLLISLRSAADVAQILRVRTLLAYLLADEIADARELTLEQIRRRAIHGRVV